MSGPGTQKGVRSPNPRRFVRYPADIRIDVQVFRPSGTVCLWGRSTELGEDGIGGTLTGEIQPGEVVSMQLALPTANRAIKFRALVRYRRGLRHGFEFLALTREQKDAVHRLCQILSTNV